MSDKKYRVGVIGHTGRGNYGHGLDRVWSEIPQAEVVAVADRHDGGRAATAKLTGAKNAYADYRAKISEIYVGNRVTESVGQRTPAASKAT